MEKVLAHIRRFAAIDAATRTVSISPEVRLSKKRRDSLLEVKRAGYIVQYTLNND